MQSGVALQCFLLKRPPKLFPTAPVATKDRNRTPERLPFLVPVENTGDGVGGSGHESAIRALPRYPTTNRTAEKIQRLGCSAA